jgi:magnesium chelatase subunit D
MPTRHSIPDGLELTWLLTCCAIEPDLRGILLLDLPESAVLGAAAGLERILHAVDPTRRPRTRLLGSHEDDDDLWTRLVVRDYGPQQDPAMVFEPAPGPLTVDEPTEDLVLAVPRLDALSTAAARAASVMLGSPVTEVQRHGIVARSTGRAFWVAACATASIGRVSPHVLDRFVVRCPASRVVRPLDAADRILAALADRSTDQTIEVPGPLPDWLVRLDATRWPAFADAALDRTLALHDPRHGARRALALLRLARATARLLGDGAVDVGHVDSVAALIGLIAPDTLNAHVSSATSTGGGGARGAEPDTTRASRQDTSLPVDKAQDKVSPAAVVEPVRLGDPATLLAPLDAVDLGGEPFPEDHSESERDAEPLRWPPQRTSAGHRGRGQVVGSEPASARGRLVDIAWPETIRTAAFYQQIRRARRPTDPGRSLQITAADVRVHRRAPQADRLLVLVLDHTCRSHWDWLPLLAPHLAEAYVQRASVALIEVGSRDAETPLRAERSVVRNLLDPRVGHALTRPAGRATPLAHGLELALRTLRHMLQHGEASIARATLVVASDGLGNVPLTASLEDRISGPVADEGVDDAREVAAAIAALDRVDRYLVEPPRAPYPDLVDALAAALDAEVETLTLDRSAP